MINIYSDEAGTSAVEPVSVVIGLLAHPDTEWFPVLGRLRSIWDNEIPDVYRYPSSKYFFFHAKWVADGARYSQWPEESRRSVMRQMMHLPLEFRMPLCFAAVKRGSFDWSGWPPELKKKMTPAKSDHYMAFMACMAQANKLIHENFDDELAQIIAEDVEDMRPTLRRAVNMLLGRPMPVEMVSKSGLTEIALHRVDKIIDDVHFLPRDNAPFLQIADACAYGMRRYFAGHRFGDEYLEAICGGRSIDIPDDDWKMISGSVYEKRIIVLPSDYGIGGVVIPPVISGVRPASAKLEKQRR